MRKLTFVLTLSGAVVATSVGLFVGACDSTPDKVGVPVQIGSGTGVVTIKNDAGPSGPSGTAGTGGGGSTSMPGPPPTGDANCGNHVASTQRLPADILLVLDRSGSMEEKTDGSGKCPAGDPNCTARWPALTSAVKSTLDGTEGSISWGLKLFSSPDGARKCTVNPGVEVEISATSVPKIQEVMANTQLGNNTPTAQAIAAATAYLKTVKDGNNKFILLATDGEPNCRGTGDNTTPNVDGTIAAITAAKAAGFPVYVVGIGPSVANRDNFARAGGTDKAFLATTPQELTDAFAAISQAVTTCTFSFAEPPEDPNNVAVYLDGKLVAKDPANGWSFGANTRTVMLNGKSCDAITSGTASKVQILFGCAGVPPPPIL